MFIKDNENHNFVKLWFFYFDTIGLNRQSFLTQLLKQKSAFLRKRF